MTKGRKKPSADERMDYIVAFVEESKKEGRSTGEIIEGYKKKFGLPKVGKGKADEKRLVIEDMQKLEHDKKLIPYKGRYLSLSYSEKDLA
jgi:hypothetical protein